MAETDDAGLLAQLLDGAMVVVTATGGDGAPAGCVVGFHTQASIEPWRHLVLLSTANHTYRVAREASHLGVNVLDRQSVDLARRFGEQTADDDAAKLTDLAWRPGPGDAPLLDAAAAWLVGPVVATLEAGDHVGFVIEPTASWVDGGRQPLRYRDVEGFHAGHPRA